MQIEAMIEIAAIVAVAALALFNTWRNKHMTTSIEGLQAAVDQQGPIINTVSTFMAGLAGTIEQLKGQTTGVSDADLDKLAATVRDHSNTLLASIQNVQLTTGIAPPDSGTATASA